MPDTLVPIRWPRAWSGAAHLDLLKQTPFNCLVAEAPFEAPGFRVVAAGGPPGVALLEGEWPQVKMANRESRDTAEAGPTGKPWVDSNGWKIRLESARHPDREVWIEYSPPKDLMPDRAAAYTVALADAAAAGGRWVLTLDEEFQASLGRREPQALNCWRAIARAASFFERRRFSGFRPVAALGVLSDFEGDNEFLAGEFLNLAPRRDLPYRILLLERAASEPWQGLRAVLYIGAKPEDRLRKKLLGFAAAGGLLIAPASLAPSGAAREQSGYRIHTVGKGRVATPGEEWSDPYVLTAETHLLMGRAWDNYRLYNAGSSALYYDESPDGRRARVQLIRFGAGRGSSAVTVALRSKYGRAALLTPEAPQPAAVQLVEARFGTEVPLPAFGPYAAIDLEAGGASRQGPSGRGEE